MRLGRDLERVKGIEGLYQSNKSNDLQMGLKLRDNFVTN